MAALIGDRWTPFALVLGAGLSKANGLDWKGWHAYRRGLATNLKKLGMPDTTIQAILRHESVSTTQRFYIKTAREDAMDAMKRFKTNSSVQQMVN